MNSRNKSPVPVGGTDRTMLWQYTLYYSIIRSMAGIVWRWLYCAARAEIARKYSKDTTKPMLFIHTPILFITIHPDPNPFAELSVYNLLRAFTVKREIKWYAYSFNLFSIRNKGEMILMLSIRTVKKKFQYDYFLLGHLLSGSIHLLKSLLKLSRTHPRAESWWTTRKPTSQSWYWISIPFFTSKYC